MNTFICHIFNRGYDPFTVISEVPEKYARRNFSEVVSCDNKHSALFTQFGTGLLVEVLSYDGKFFIIQTETLTYIGAGLHQDKVSYKVCERHLEARVRSAIAGHWHQPCPAFERRYEHLFADNEGNIFAFVKGSDVFAPSFIPKQDPSFGYRVITEGLLEYFK